MGFPYERAAKIAVTQIKNHLEKGGFLEK